MGHICPRGPKCLFLKQGKCKYTRRESVHFPSHYDEGFFDAGDAHKAEMHLPIPKLHGKHRVHSQSLDGFSEVAPSESANDSW